MTREEAIKTLKGEAWICCAEKWNEALEMASKALEQEPCGDCISRQAVDKLFSDAYESKSVNLNEDWKKLIWIREHIRELTPVTPVEKVGHWVNNQNGTYTCDICVHKHSKSNYCAFCGAKMSEVEE